MEPIINPSLTMKTKTTVLTLCITLCLLILSIVSFAQAPPNDDCSGAIALTPGTTCTIYTGTDSLATASPVPVCTGSAEDDVWFKFTPTYSYVCIKVTGAGIFDPVIQVFSGSCGGTSINCTNATGAGGTENITLNGLTAGNPYWIRIYDAQPFPPPSPHFNICLTYCGITPPANDDCSAAVHIAENLTCVPTTGTVLGASDSGVPASPNCSLSNPDDDVWYGFTATSTAAQVTVAASASFDPCFEVFANVCGITSIGCNAPGGQPGATISSCVQGLIVGATYHIRVYDYGTGFPTTPTFTICVTDCQGVGIDAYATNTGFTIAPNPFTTQTTITFNQEQKSIPVRIRDVLGKEIRTVIFSGKALIIDKGDLAKGIYFINAAGANRKIVIE